MSDIPEAVLATAFDLVEAMQSNKMDALTAGDARYANILTNDANVIARALMAADEAATKRAAQWQPIETAPEGQTVLATYQNSHKKWRTIKAVRYDKFSREISGADDLEQDYDEESDSYYWQAGWYEIIENWDDYTHIVVNIIPTHWMPLPPPPAILKGEA